LNMNYKNILVTGGAGFIGSHLVDELVNQGHRVRILDSLVGQVHINGVPNHLNKEAEFIKADICNAKAVSKALDGIEVVFHEAAEVGVGQSMYEIVRYVKANDLGTAVLLEEMIKRRDQFKKLIVASSMSIYGEGAYRCDECDKVTYPFLRSEEQLKRHDWEIYCKICRNELKPIRTSENKPLFPTSVYAVSKQNQEQYSLSVGRAYNIPTVALRYFNAYGTRQALSNPYTGVCAIFSSRLLNNQSPLIFEDGEQTRDFVHISDVVQANILALQSDEANFQTFNVGTGVPTSVKDITVLLAEGLEKDIQPEIVGKYREGDIRHCIADITKAQKLLNYKPQVSLSEGIPELIEWVRRQDADDTVVQAKTELETRNLVK
jgi:dTDP-L-rhamnose 4-epimerase